MALLMGLSSNGESRPAGQAGLAAILVIWSGSRTTCWPLMMERGRKVALDLTERLAQPPAGRRHAGEALNGCDFNLTTMKRRAVIPTGTSMEHPVGQASRVLTSSASVPYLATKASLAAMWA